MKRNAFPIIGMEGLTIDGNGSEFVFYGRMIPFVLDDSRNMAIRTLSIDCDRPFFTQGETVEADDRVIELRIFIQEFPYRVENGVLIFYSGEWESDWFELLLRRPGSFFL